MVEILNRLKAVSRSCWSNMTWTPMISSTADSLSVLVNDRYHRNRQRRQLHSQQCGRAESLSRGWPCLN
jgi:hypothetical protein